MITSWMRKGRRLTFVSLIVPGLIFAAQAVAGEAPFGDKVSAAIYNYTRASPFIASAGTLGEGGVAEAKALGFKTIVDLRTAEEGTVVEKVEATGLGLRYVNLPVAGGAPSDEQVARFAAIAEDPSNYPVLLHCAAGNRTGALWALYRARRNVPPEVAVDEGRTLGLRPNRERVVRHRLGLPQLSR